MYLQNVMHVRFTVAPMTRKPARNSAPHRLLRLNTHVADAKVILNAAIERCNAQHHRVFAAQWRSAQAARPPLARPDCLKAVVLCIARDKFADLPGASIPITMVSTLMWCSFTRLGPRQFLNHGQGARDDQNVVISGQNLFWSTPMRTKKHLRT